ncbi:hypothetical protein BDY19DRAFT_966894 [Irpex rosettiformis]|uniref:Uncharacterized protein n=1 Tax=Irpex rosettiformis TaxID=378272 RepID=A0ACB8TT80_9APHY|nr:hypothetical protein BDY19DRAFT_966894 [Irpex rosettiformis]
MSSPFANYPAPERSFVPQTYTPRGSTPTPARGTGAKRGRKPKNPALGSTDSFRQPQSASPTASTPTTIQWATVQSTSGAIPGTSSNSQPQSPVTPAPPTDEVAQQQAQLGSETGGVISLPGIITPQIASAEVPSSARASLAPAGPPAPEDEGEGDDEWLFAMAEDDYSAQLSWQSQSKDNLKVLMDNFTPAQYDRFEASRRHALPKQAVRKVIQSSLGQQVSQPVAQIVAGFAKVFVGEIIEKAREIQAKRGEVGPLSPDHLREAYRLYQQETGRVGAARPLKGKRLFVR